MKVVLVTGGFDPLHSGHIEYFKEAKKLGDKLVVAVNSDAWLTRKKGRPFMPFEERIKIIEALDIVDQTTYVMNDDKHDDAGGAIFHTFATNSNIEIIFANGGDRTKGQVPEEEQWGKDPRVTFVYGVGGTNKMNSSSWILAEWKAPKTERVWGYYRVLHESGKEVKVKELTVEPGKRLSMQRHEKRSEHWFVDSGVATVYTLDSSSDVELLGVYEKHQSLHIPVGTWHQLSNEHTEPLKLVEIQYGTNCVEEDIERTA